MLKIFIVPLLFCVALGAEISDRDSLKCYGSNGWGKLDSLKLEKTRCFSRCFTATAFNENGEMGKFGCELMDYKETLLTPFIDHVHKSQNLRGMLNIKIDKQELFARGELGKSTIDTIKSGGKLFLNGSYGLKIDDFKYDVSAKGLINLSNLSGLVGHNKPSLKACFGKSEICDDFNPNDQISIIWLWTEFISEKKVKIILDEFEVDISITGDLGKVLHKVMTDKKFEANLKYQMDTIASIADKSYLQIDYQGTTSASRYMSMIANHGPGLEPILEYFYNEAEEIEAYVNIDNDQSFRAKGCSEKLCNDPKRFSTFIEN